MICVIVCVMFMSHNMCHVIEQNKTEHVMLYITCVLTCYLIHYMSLYVMII